MTRVLVSVRSVTEACEAAAAGADLIDLKEPATGALGALPLATIRAIVSALRGAGMEQPISATIGDGPLSDVAEIDQRIAAVAECRVDYVKVGVKVGIRGPHTLAWQTLTRLAHMRQTIIPVLIADDGVDVGLVAHAVHLGFAAIMLDTQDKNAGSLLERLPEDDLRAALAVARQAGVAFGLAGALRASDLPRLARLAPDFAGFRSAVCAGARSDALDAQRVRNIVAELGGAHATLERTVTPRVASSLRLAALHASVPVRHD